jgi:hypothetical protein
MPQAPTHERETDQSALAGERDEAVIARAKSPATAIRRSVIVNMTPSLILHFVDQGIASAMPEIACRLWTNGTVLRALLTIASQIGNKSGRADFLVSLRQHPMQESAH